MLRRAHPALFLSFALACSGAARAQDAAADSEKKEATAEPSADGKADAASKPADEKDSGEEEAKSADGAESKPEDAKAPDAEPADAAPEASQTPSPDEAEATTGALTISASPNGRVFIDDVDTGLNTPLIDHAVEPGTHTVKVVELATGREKTLTFHIEAGAALNLNLNLPEAQKPEPTAESTESESAGGEEIAAASGDAVQDWSWWGVAGWTGLGLGTISILSGAVVLTTPGDVDQGPLGFSLFGGGAALVLGGGVLLYLEDEFASSDSADTATEGGAATRLGFSLVE